MVSLLVLIPGSYHIPRKKDRGKTPVFSSYQTIDDPVHFLLAAGIVGLVENGLLLLLGHGGIGIQGLGIPGQSHAKTVKGSTLDAIPGVGEVRRTALLKHFKSLKAIKEASLEQLQQVVPKNTAKAVYEWFRQDKSEE